MLRIDRLIQTACTQRWPFWEVCHLMPEFNAVDGVGGIDELHRVAAALGIEPMAFTFVAGKIPHYVLTRQERERALLSTDVMAIEQDELLLLAARFRCEAPQGQPFPFTEAELSGAAPVAPRPAVAVPVPVPVAKDLPWRPSVPVPPKVKAGKQEDPAQLALW